MCFSNRAELDEDYHVPARTVNRAPRPVSRIPSRSPSHRVEERSPRSSSKRLSQVHGVVGHSPHQSVNVVLRTPRSSRHSVDVVERSPRTSRQSVQLSRVPSRQSVQMMRISDPFLTLPRPEPFLNVPVPDRFTEIPAPQLYQVPMPTFRPIPAPVVHGVPRVATPPPAPIAPTAKDLRSNAKPTDQMQHAPAMHRDGSSGQQNSSQGRDRRTTVENENGVIENVTKAAQRSISADRSRDGRLLEGIQRPVHGFRLSEERIMYDAQGKRSSRTLHYQPR